VPWHAASNAVRLQLQAAKQASPSAPAQDFADLNALADKAVQKLEGVANGPLPAKTPADVIAAALKLADKATLIANAAAGLSAQVRAAC
jgi:hypothetical protein